MPEHVASVMHFAVQVCTLVCPYDLSGKYFALERHPSMVYRRRAFTSTLKTTDGMTGHGISTDTLDLMSAGLQRNKRHGGEGSSLSVESSSTR